MQFRTVPWLCVIDGVSESSTASLEGYNCMNAFSFLFLSCNAVRKQICMFFTSLWGRLPKGPEHTGDQLFYCHYWSLNVQNIKYMHLFYLLFQVWEHNPDDVMVMSSGLSRLELGNYKFITESLRYNLGQVVWKLWAFTRSGGLMIDAFELHHGKCSI